MPMMMDFIEHGSRDPYLFVDYANSYFNFILKVENEVNSSLTKLQFKLLELFCKEINNSKRVEESLIIKLLIESGNLSLKDFKEIILKKYNYSIRCVEIDCSKELALHNNAYRNYKYNINRIPEIAYNIFIKRFEKPTLDEGFDEIIKLKPYKSKDLDYLLFYF
jgi:hypothetical protein